MFILYLEREIYYFTYQMDDLFLTILACLTRVHCDLSNKITELVTLLMIMVDPMGFR